MADFKQREWVKLKWADPALFMAQSMSQNMPEKNHRLRFSKPLMLVSPNG